MKNHFKNISLIILSLTFSCSISNIEYDRQKIEKKYSDKYDVFLDSKEVDFKNVFLDKGNIRTILVDRKEKVVKILQIESRNLYDLKDLKIDSLNSSLMSLSNNGIIVFNGVPISDLICSDIKLDPKSITSFKILSKEEMMKTTWYNNQGNLVLITTY